MIDFNLFFERAFACALMDRVFLAWHVAVAPGFAERTFNAYSATARLRVVAMILGWRGATSFNPDEESGEPNLIEVAH